MNRSLINNAVLGLSTGYEKTLELVGVGYRASIKGNQLNLQLGFSHDINFVIPDGPSIFRLLPAKTTFTFSGIEMFILPILDIKIPYKLFRHQLFVFLRLYQS